MKFPIQAGKDIETVTPDELRRELRSWFAEVVRGVRFRNVSGAGNLSAAGAALITIDGPDEGFLWSITRMSLFGTSLAAAPAEWVSVFRNDVSGTTLIHPQLITAEFINPGSVMVKSGEQIIVRGDGLPVARDIVLSLSVKETPITTAWQQ